MSRSVKTALFALLMGLAGLLASAVFSHFGLEEKVGLYLLFKSRGVQEAPEEVMVVAMDRSSVRDLDLARETHKWPRDLHARLIEALSADSPGVIAFDVIFDEAKDPARDDDFAAAMAVAGNVVLCEYVEKEMLSVAGTAVSMEKRSRPIDLFAGVSVGSGPFPLPKRPVRVGQIWLFKSGAEEIPTLPVVAFQTWALPAYDAFRQTLAEANPALADSLPSSREGVLTEGVDLFASRMRTLFENTPGLSESVMQVLDGAPFSSEEKAMVRSLINLYSGPGSRYVCFYGPAGTVKTLSYGDLMASAGTGGGENADTDSIGKAVFVGLSDTRQVQEDDVFFTVFSQENGIDLSGVEIAATTFGNLLTDSWVTPLGGKTCAMVVVFGGILMGLVSFTFRPSRSIPAVATMGMAYLLFCRFAFSRWGLWCPVVTPVFFQIPVVLLAALLMRYAQVKRERRRIRSAFGRYLPEKVVNRLASEFQGHEDQLVYGVCLFTDAQQYTRMAEEMNPVALRDLMNRYYEIAFSPVTVRGGFISDVVGDAMLAIWTAREPDPAMAVSACRAALEIAAGIEQFKDKHGTAYLPTRMGVHAGYVSIGDVGAGGHFEYRAVGDIVNTASRIEGLNKELGTTILVSSEVSRQIEGFTLHPKGEFMLKGKSVPVSVSELVSWDGR